MDLSFFALPETWITLVTLLFLELALGIDNLVFISITSERLPRERQSLGRKLGLAGALAMRIVFLCFASALVHMTTPLFTLAFGSFSHGFSVRDLVLLIGGSYLVYKGASELCEMHAPDSRMADSSKAQGKIGLSHAVLTIMAMDVVFSIDSVITAVGIADQLLVMIIAVVAAILIMMAFVDQISGFIMSNPGIKRLTLVFMAAIGALLVVESFGFGTDVEVIGIELEKLITYLALGGALLCELLKNRRGKTESAGQYEHQSAL